MPDFVRLALSARRCNAAYIVDPRAASQAFAALGSTFISQYRNLNHQAVLSRDSAGQVTLTISGTRFSAGPIFDRVGDLLADIDWTPKEIEPGILVADGAHSGLDEMWAWVFKNLPFGYAGTINVEGHSLGGWRTAYSPVHCPRSWVGTLTAFEPPKAGNAAFWDKYMAGVDYTVVVLGRDPWFAWPWESAGMLIQRPGTGLIWLDNGKFNITTDWDWPGVNPLDIRFSDHGPDTVITALAALAAK